MSLYQLLYGQNQYWFSSSGFSVKLLQFKHPILTSRLEGDINCNM